MGHESWHNIFTSMNRRTTATAPKDSEDKPARKIGNKVKPFQFIKNIDNTCLPSELLSLMYKKKARSAMTQLKVQKSEYKIFVLVVFGTNRKTFEITFNMPV